MDTDLNRRKLVFGAFVTAVLAGCAATPTRESTGEYIDDSAITAKVKAKLVKDKQTSALAIKVVTYKGVVQLSGFANSATEKMRAGELAESVSGVKSVENNISVK